MSTPAEHSQAQRDSARDLVSEVYADLLRMATIAARSRSDSPSSLVQETVCRLLGQSEPPRDEDSLRAAAFRIMGWLLVDRHRARIARAAREAEAGRVYADASSAGQPPREHHAVCTAFAALAQESPRRAEAFGLHVIGEVPTERIAELLGVDVRTIQRDIAFARAWLADAVPEGLRSPSSKSVEEGGPE